MSTYEVGQTVIATTIASVPHLRGNKEVRKIMEVARVIEDHQFWGEEGTETGYKLRKPGSSSRGGDVIWKESDLSPME